MPNTSQTVDAAATRAPRRRPRRRIAFQRQLHRGRPLRGPRSRISRFATDFINARDRLGFRAQFQSLCIPARQVPFVRRDLSGEVEGKILVPYRDGIRRYRRSCTPRIPRPESCPTCGRLAKVHVIPPARCSNGLSYAVFYKFRPPSRLAISVLTAAALL
jgi:hypothetical protein